MKYTNTPLLALERDLADAERNVAELRTAVQARRTTLNRQTGAITMRDARLPWENLSTLAGRVDATAASTLVTDC